MLIIVLLIIIFLYINKDYINEYFNNHSNKENNIFTKVFTNIFNQSINHNNTKNDQNNSQNTYIDNKNNKTNEIYMDTDCINLDPIFMLKKRVETRPIKICDIESTKHICYNNINTNPIIYTKFPTKNGVICISENIIIDPSKWEKVTINALNYLNMGTPLLSKGFFSTKCGNITIIDDYYYLYDQYFNGWNYEYEDNMEYIGELAPGKTIFLLYRNIESFSTFHGLCEFISAISLMHILKLKPEDIKIIFLDSCCKKKN
jgi:hypothetical protein